MEKYKKCIIAFLDILGFKHMIDTKAFEEIRKIFLTIVPQSDLELALKRETDDEDERGCNYNNVLSDTKVHIMSDSIIIAAPEGRSEALAVVIDICNMIQHRLYELAPPVFLRGAIAEGDFYLDEQLIFGKGLVNTYIAQENYAIYPRIIISDEVTEKCASAEAMILLQKDEDCYWYIDTLNHYFNSNTWDDLQSSKKYKKIKQYIDKNLYGYSERRVREKYIWLQKELKRIEREKKYLAPRGMMGVRGVSGALWYMMAEEFHEMEDEDE